jgi:hypothetical protein
MRHGHWRQPPHRYFRRQVNNWNGERFRKELNNSRMVRHHQ